MRLSGLARGAYQLCQDHPQRVVASDDDEDAATSPRALIVSQQDTGVSLFDTRRMYD